MTGGLNYLIAKGNLEQDRLIQESPLNSYPSHLDTHQCYSFGPWAGIISLSPLGTRWMALRKGIPVSKHGKHGKFLDLARLRCRDVGIEIGFMMDFGGVLVPRTGPAWQGCGCACQACQARPAPPRPAPLQCWRRDRYRYSTVAAVQSGQHSTVGKRRRRRQRKAQHAYSAGNIWLLG
jgi:hypothetical protein